MLVAFVNAVLTRATHRLGLDKETQRQLLSMFIFNRHKKWKQRLSYSSEPSLTEKYSVHRSRDANPGVGGCFFLFSFFPCFLFCLTKIFLWTWGQIQNFERLGSRNPHHFLLQHEVPGAVFRHQHVIAVATFSRHPAQALSCGYDKPHLFLPLPLEMQCWEAMSSEVHHWKSILLPISKHLFNRKKSSLLLY